MHTVNKIAVEPFPDKSVKAEIHGEGKFGVSKIANTKSNLVRLKVLVDAERPVGNSIQRIFEDSYVWVRASDYSNPWGKEIMTDGIGQPFILIPFERVELFEESESL